MRNNREIVEFFAIPVIKFSFPKHLEYVSKWQNWERCARQPNGWSCEVNTSFPDVDDNDPFIDMDLVKQLKGDLLFEIKKTLKSYTLDPDIVFHAFWYNAYYTQQGQEKHHHLADHNNNPIWSGVYFAKNCHSGQFAFHKNDFSLRTQGYFDVTNSPLRRYYEDVTPTKFADGDIVLFPPHLHHAVKVDEKNRDEQRLTFSFNIDSVAAMNFRRDHLKPGEV